MSQPAPDVDVDAIARDLESYVAIHPAAADTIEGIARWWLARPVQPARSQVAAALEALVRKGVLSRRSLPDGNFIYARAARTHDT